VGYSFGGVCQFFRLHIIRELVEIARWYVAYHAQVSTKDLAQYLPRLRHQGKTADNGGRAA
jgi:hypothetical protein